MQARQPLGEPNRVYIHAGTRVRWRALPLRHCLRHAPRSAAALRVVRAGAVLMPPTWTLLEYTVSRSRTPRPPRAAHGDPAACDAP